MPPLQTTVGVIFQGFDRTSASAQQVSNSIKRVGATASIARQAMAGLGLAIGVQGLVSALRSATKAAMEFEQSIAKIATLIPGETRQIQNYSEKIEELSVKWGLSVDEISRATYDMVSAGHKGKESFEVMEVAARAAVGGFADMQEAMGGIVTIMNAYELSASEATHIADAMFQTNKLGLTTFGELSRGVGIAAKSAAQAGVSYRELLASVATLTKQMGSGKTSEAFTAITGLIQSLRKPTEMSKKVAYELGIQWDINVVKAKGLAGAMEQLKIAFERNEEKAVKLIRRIEGFKAALILMSETGNRDAAEMLELLNTKFGQLEEASKEAETKTRDLKKAQEELAKIMRDLGEIILPVVVTVMEAIVSQFKALQGIGKDLKSTVEGVATAMFSLPILEFKMVNAGLDKLFGYDEFNKSLEETAEAAKKARKELDELYEQRRIYGMFGMVPPQDMPFGPETPPEKKKAGGGWFGDKEGMTIEVPKPKKGRAGRRYDPEEISDDLRAKFAEDEEAYQTEQRRKEEYKRVELEIINEIGRAKHEAAQREQAAMDMLDKKRDEDIEKQKKQKEQTIQYGIAAGQSFVNMLMGFTEAKKAQAAINAAFEVAESIAAFARYDYWSGIQHASAAVSYGLVAGGVGEKGKASGSSGAGAGSSGFSTPTVRNSENDQRVTIIHLNVNGSLIENQNSGQWIQESLDAAMRADIIRDNPRRVEVQ